jgi:hypothetical protein
MNSVHFQRSQQRLSASIEPTMRVNILNNTNSMKGDRTSTPEAQTHNIYKLNDVKQPRFSNKSLCSLPRAPKLQNNAIFISKIMNSKPPRNSIVEIASNKAASVG